MANFRRKLTVFEESKINFRVWITDVDANIMNHAPMMTVMEMGRIDFMVRCGFFSIARRKKWYFPLKSISVQFLRPLKVFQKANLITRVFHADEKWIYLEHQIIRKGKIIAICIAKATVKKGRETIPTKEITEILGIDKLPAQGADLIDTYERENHLSRQRLC